MVKGKMCGGGNFQTITYQHQNKKIQVKTKVKSYKDKMPTPK